VQSSRTDETLNYPSAERLCGDLSAARYGHVDAPIRRMIKMLKRIVNMVSYLALAFEVALAAHAVS
jgi:hypothetical protein